MDPAQTAVHVVAIDGHGAGGSLAGCALELRAPGGGWLGGRAALVASSSLLAANNTVALSNDAAAGAALSLACAGAEVLPAAGALPSRFTVVPATPLGWLAAAWGAARTAALLCLLALLSSPPHCAALVDLGRAALESHSALAAAKRRRRWLLKHIEEDALPPVTVTVELSPGELVDCADVTLAISAPGTVADPPPLEEASPAGDRVGRLLRQKVAGEFIGKRPPAAPISEAARQLTRALLPAETVIATAVARAAAQPPTPAHSEPEEAGDATDSTAEAAVLTADAKPAELDEKAEEIDEEEAEAEAEVEAEQADEAEAEEIDEADEVEPPVRELVETLISSAIAASRQPEPVPISPEPSLAEPAAAQIQPSPSDESDDCAEPEASENSEKPSPPATPLKPPAVSRTREDFLRARSLLREHRDCRRASRGPVSTAELAKATEILRRILGATPGKSALR